MLGLSDRSATRRLLEQILLGDGAGLLATLKEQEELGVEPVATINALLELIHGVTTAKAGRGAGLALHAEAERNAIEGWATTLSFPVLHRLWQLLLKGHEEVTAAARPLAACEMALLRLVHAAQMPDPGDLARLLKERGLGLEGAPPSIGGPPPADAAPMAEAPPWTAELARPSYPADFPALVELLSHGPRPRLGNELHDCVSLVRYAPPELDVFPLEPLDANFVRDVATALKDATGQPWTVNLTGSRGEPSLREQQLAKADARREEIRATPIVAAALAAFPGAALAEPDSLN